MVSSAGTIGSTEWRIETPSLVIAAPAIVFAELGDAVVGEQRSGESDKRETGGVLFGRFSGDIVRIEAFRRVEHAESPGFRLSPDDMEEFGRVLSSTGPGTDLPDLEPVGWYRSEHRDMFYSEEDQALFKRFFPYPWQVSLIVRWATTEPVQLGVFTRDLNGRAKFRCTVAIEVPPVAGETDADEPPPVAETASEVQSHDPVDEAQAGDAASWTKLPVRSDPFPPRLDTDFVRISTQHRQAVAELYYGALKREGTLLLTGDPDVGRRQVLESLGDLFNQQQIEFAFLPEPPRTLGQFYEMVGYDLGFTGPAISATETLSKLTDLAIRQSSAQSMVALVLDEADLLPMEVMAEIARMDQLQHRRKKLLQIVLAGTSVLEARLVSPEIRDLQWLIAHRVRLHRMDELEVAEYVEGRLIRAGLAEERLIPEAQLAIIAAQSQGLPLEVHRRCAEFLRALPVRGPAQGSSQHLHGLLAELRNKAEGA
ncbi:AAA family ATPase [uncultured Paludibaculum sp.]|uniref:ExeA family protein n=1 Tax=uncultured Paludibaculum sp. TaxID=1765020 RepID=UPI002AAAA3AC|nr:AAA family ATPase [uncultured Paludibaculum sp.]